MMIMNTDNTIETLNSIKQVCDGLNEIGARTHMVYTVNDGNNIKYLSNTAEVIQFLFDLGYRCCSIRLKDWEMLAMGYDGNNQFCGYYQIRIGLEIDNIPNPDQLCEIAEIINRIEPV